MKKKVLIIAISFSVVASLLIGGFFIYTSDYYHTDITAVECIQIEDNIKVDTLDNGTIVAQPKKSKAGLIFYPGGKVEYTAYKPLITELASHNITCALVKMPFNIAFFNEDGADEVRRLYPDIEDWYMCGHSLGGVVASNYIAKHLSNYKGLILLASYSPNDISKSSLRVLSIYGSEDKVLNIQKYEENRSNLPTDFQEKIIQGGCHSQFGYYGEQAGDGQPTISTQEQISITSDYIVNFIFNR